jgi:DHA2 family multidrug resistance protein
MGNATSLFNLMRNLGGSVGIATVAMMNTRFQQKYTAILGEHVNATDPQATAMFGGLRSMFLASGSGAGLADQRAYASLFGLVERQAAMRAFVDLFYFLTIAFVAMIPLTLIMRKPKGGAGPGAGAH